MIRNDHKLAAFEIMLKVFDSREHTEQFAVVRRSVSDNFREKKPIGCQLLSTCCSSDAPIATSDASVIRAICAVGDG